MEECETMMMARAIVRVPDADGIGYQVVEYDDHIDDNRPISRIFGSKPEILTWLRVNGYTEEATRRFVEVRFHPASFR